MDKRISQYFEQFPQQNELYETTDGQVFLNKEHANGHAKRLKKKTVTTHSRGTGVKMEMVTALTKEQANARLLELDLSVAKGLVYEELQQLVAALELTADGKKKETYVDLLAGYKANLKTDE